MLFLAASRELVVECFHGCIIPRWQEKGEEETQGDGVSKVASQGQSYKENSVCSSIWISSTMMTLFLFITSILYPLSNWKDFKLLVGNTLIPHLESVISGFCFYLVNLPIGSTTAVNPDAKWRSKDVKGMPSHKFVGHIEMFRQEKEAQDFSDLSGHGLEFVAFESSTVRLSC